MIQIDMPMPDNCVECRFNVSEFGYCNAMPVEFVGQVSDCEEDGRPEWCPLKAQEPDETRLVRHYSRPNVYADLWLHCEKCGGVVDNRYRPTFCPNCGRKVKWK